MSFATTAAVKMKSAHHRHHHTASLSLFHIEWVTQNIYTNNIQTLNIL